MSCGVNIPLSSVVEAIVNDYADVFVGEILKRVSLDNSKISNATINGALLNGKITLDQDALASFCLALQDCIAAKIQSELTCERDNYVTDFAIDKANDRITITMKFGEKHHISKEELKSWIGAIGGGQDNDTKVTGGSLAGTTLNLTLSDGTSVPIDLSKLNTGSGADGNTFVTAGAVQGKTLTLTRNDSQTVQIDLSNFSTTDNDTLVTGGSLVGHTLTLTLSNGDNVGIDLSSLSVGKDSPFIVSGVFVSRDGGYWLDFTRNDNTKVNVDMTAIINELVNTLRTQILGMGYTLKTENNHYTTQAEDFNGFTIIRANHNGDQTITLTKPDDSFIGKALIVRKTNGGVGTFVTLKAGGGVTISPADSTPLRRVGSSATLVYTGGGNWDVFGELP